MVDYNNLEPIYEKVRQYSDKFIVYSMHWGPNWVQGEIAVILKNLEEV